MSKQSIYTANNRNRLVVDKVNKSIFDCLLSHKEGITQTDMAVLLNLKQPTISNRLRKIGPNPFIYNENVYIISKIKGSYQMIKLENLYCSLTSNATNEQKEKFTELLNTIISYFVNNKIFNSDSAILVSDTVVLYKIKQKYSSNVKTELHKLYNESIYDIVSCESGLYIILNQYHLGKKNLPIIRESILSLYENVVTLIKRNKLSSRLFVKKEKKE